MHCHSAVKRRKPEEKYNRGGASLPEYEGILPTGTFRASWLGPPHHQSCASSLLNFEERKLGPWHRNFTPAFLVYCFGPEECWSILIWCSFIDIAFSTEVAQTCSAPRGGQVGKRASRYVIQTNTRFMNWYSNCMLFLAPLTPLDYQPRGSFPSSHT